MWNLRSEVKVWKQKSCSYETPLKEKSQEKSDFRLAPESTILA